MASFDLDARQGTLTRYLQNRSEFMKLNGITLPVSDHTSWTEEKAKIYSFAGQIEKIADQYDAIIVDTPGTHVPLVIEAMALADVVVTPINDSLD